MNISKQKIIFSLFLAMFALEVFGWMSATRAAELTSVTDTLSTQVIDATANHSIRFTTPSGVGAGETITIDFASGFNMGSVDFTDIDVQNNGGNVDLAAVASGSVWGAVVSGQVITITSDTGTIATGNIVTVKIGTNATAGSLGDAQIVNPSSAGSYTINIGGTFGDSKQLAVAITGSTSVTVGATVSAITPPPSTGGGSAAPAASEAGTGGLSGFVIFNEIVGGIGETAATITFETDIPTIGSVSYGLTPAYELYTFTGTSFSTLHIFSLLDLIPGKTYFVKMNAQSQAGGVETRENLMFTTVALPDEVSPPNVSEFQAQQTDGAALLTWKNPVAEDFEKVIVKKSTESFVKNPLEGETIFEGNLENFTDAEIVAGQNIYYSIFAVDKIGNTSSGAIAELRVEVRPPAVKEEKLELPLLPGGIIPAEVAIPVITVSEKEHIPSEELRYFVRQGSIELVASLENEIHVVRGEPMSLTIPAGLLAQRVQSILFALDGFSFFLTYNPKTAAYETTVMMPDKIGKYQGAVIVRYADGSVDVTQFVALIDPYGYVFERVRRAESRVEGAEVSLFVLQDREWVLWPAMNYAQVNPQRTGPTGEFSFMVPQGTYYLEAKKEGYASKKTDIFQVVDHIVNRNIELRSEAGFVWTDIVDYARSHWKQIFLPIATLLIILRVMYLWKTTRKPQMEPALKEPEHISEFQDPSPQTSVTGTELSHENPSSKHSEILQTPTEPPTEQK